MIVQIISFCFTLFIERIRSCLIGSKSIYNPHKMLYILRGIKEVRAKITLRDISWILGELTSLVWFFKTRYGSTHITYIN